MTTADTKKPNSESVQIMEMIAAPGTSLHIDREKCVVKGVKLIGTESKNGRDYPLDVIRRDIGVYEGAKVNINHPEKGPNQPRGYQDRFGVIRNARVEGNGGYGDFHYNPKHAITEQFLWDAEHSPESVGFSHNATLRMKPAGSGRSVVESILAVKSVDLVADPATTLSLFEHTEVTEMDEMTPAAPVAPKVDAKNAFRDLIMAAVDDDGLDMKATLSKIKDILKAQEKLMGGGGSSSAPMDDAEAEEQITTLQLQLKNVEQALEQYKQKEANEARVALVQQKLEAAGLDPKNPIHVSDLFSKQLLEAKDEPAMEALIKDRAEAIAANRQAIGQPRSQSVHQTTEQHNGTNMTAEDFSRRLRRM